VVNEISIYSGHLTPLGITESMIKIKRSFPELDKEFYDILQDRLKENKFCDSRLKDAVNHVIDHCVYPRPTIAEFISYDKRVRLYSYYEAVEYCTERNIKISDFFTKKDNFWVLKTQ